MTRNNLFLVTAVFGLLFTSCDDDNHFSPSTKNLTINVAGLEDLGSDYVYEGWIIVDGAPVSTGTFSDISLGQNFSVDAEELDAATRFVLSIEPAGETGTAAATPSDTKLVVGDFSGSSATVSVGTVGDFTTDTPAGKFFLRSPTDESADNNGNDESGIWFGTPGTPPTAAFTLPTLEAGWKYEGWVVVDGQGPLSTGTFTAFDVADDNAGSATSFSGIENAGPPIPGEDFFSNTPTGFSFPLDIRGRTIVISVEPSPDNSPTPFLLKPLLGAAGNETAPATYDLTFNGASFPSGTVNR
ncbi:anti-sigma factor [Aureibaculum algae]|uniref:Anti-sigma factor n=1 Tax=Aureibaculum algae TaxID=2584122 RepID=A0A5B7TSW3_9FLAO|nr:anti-sigma factor [Aureibaculum algae]QCX39298.1 anti-sigma factor [Aureibaculum algae]